MRHPLRNFLISGHGSKPISAEAAKAYIRALAGNELKEIPGITISSPVFGKQIVSDQAVSDYPSPHTSFKSPEEERAWLDAMSPKLAERLPDRRMWGEFLITEHNEATHAGLSPQMVLGLIDVASNFNKYAVLSAGARGYMQVMPFWTQQANRSQDNLFHVRVNLRYGCWILRYYLDQNNGDLPKALAAYAASNTDKNSQREALSVQFAKLVIVRWKEKWS